MYVQYVRYVQSHNKKNDIFSSDLAAEVHKRQQQWEAMDYGWGGGRFGKRAGADAVPKRYDMYGSYGRFGRDDDHVDPDARQ